MDTESWIDGIQAAVKAIQNYEETCDFLGRLNDPVWCPPVFKALVNSREGQGGSIATALTIAEALHAHARSIEKAVKVARYAAGKKLDEQG